MSDEELSEDGDFSGSEDGDFSGSEEEWRPDGEKPSSSDFESDRDNEAVDVPQKTKSKTVKKKLSNSSSPRVLKKKPSQSLRTKMFNMYKPLPKSLNTPTQPLKNKSLSSILESSTFKQPKKIPSSQNTEDSDSSSNDYMVNPKDLDLQSSFFDVKSNQETNEKPPEFDCNAGLCLTDSEEEDDFLGVEEEDEQNQSRCVEKSLSEKSNLDNSNLKHLHDYAIRLESAKKHLKSIKTVTTKEQNVDVSELLAMGETKAPEVQNKSTKKRKKGGESESESDWEEVKDEKSQTHVSKEGIQVTVQLQEKTRDKKTIDVEATLKRKLNRIIKENQIYFHKTSLLCHIAYGIYCNKALNNPSLMAQALKMLPNKTCYPSGRTEIKYFESIAKWYKTAISVKSNKMYSYFRTCPPLPISLALQIRFKGAICKRDFVFIFIVLLRAMGMQCRMVMNLVPLPIKPAQSDLCKISIKKESKEEQNESVKYKISEAMQKEEIENVKIKNSPKNQIIKELKEDKAITESKNEKKADTFISSRNSEQNNSRVSSRTRKKLKKTTNKDDVSTQVDQEKLSGKGENLKNSNGVNKQKDEEIQSKGTNQKSSIKKLAKRVEVIKKSEGTITSTHFKQKNKNLGEEKREKSSRSTRSKSQQKQNLNLVDIPQFDGADDDRIKESRTTGRKKLKHKFPKKHPDPPTDSENEFVPSAPKKRKTLSAVKS